MNRLNRTRLLQPLAGCLLAGLLVAACAEPGDGDGGAGQGASTTTEPATSTTTAPTEPTRTGGPVTVVGTVGGERAELRPGRRLAVTGRVDRGLLSTCQQGEPLVVASIKAIA